MVALREVCDADAGWLVRAHGEAYARDEGFDASFEDLVGEIVTAFLHGHDPLLERGWIAQDDTGPLGSIFCVSQAPGVAKLRLFFLLPEARGRGVGWLLLDTCMGFAREAGYRRMELWTHAEHRAACALYAKAGFARLSARPVHSFGVDLTEENWGIDL
ncbi:N-acetyltransferase family protein [Primorskyibacter sp. S187A]|uniref:GNAT family N-acetyltransferase n=1 Tax=Primorskyibacter sp. S187A TaxID=3415130 RepID=UPI003C7A8133